MDKVGLIIFSSKGLYIFKNNEIKPYKKFNFHKNLIIKCYGNEIFGINFNERIIYKLANMNNIISSFSNPIKQL